MKLGEMTKFECRLLERVDSHFSAILVIGCAIAGMIARYALRGFISADYSDFLLPWYGEISENGLGEQVGNYNFVYQFLIWLMTKINLSPLYAYKILSIVFDLLLSVVVARVVFSVTQDKPKLGNVDKWAIAFSLVWLSPIVLLNSACWAQCDAIYVTFIMLATWFLIMEKYTPSFLLLGVSFAFKLQTVFILPLFFYVYFIKREFSILKFLWVLVGFFALSVPLIFWGRSPVEAISVYVGQTGTWPMMSFNYASFWCFLCSDQNAQAYVYMKYPAVILTAFLLLTTMVWWKKEGTIDTKGTLMLAFLLAYTCVLFLPSMHERYSYLYEILAIMLVFVAPKTIPLCLGLIAISLNTYGAYLFGVSTNMQVVACFNVAVYTCYFCIINQEVKCIKQATKALER